jgi:hypothetical protein
VHACVLARAVSHAADQQTDLVNDLGIEGGQRNVCIGVPGREVGVASAVLTLLPQSLRQRFCHTDAWL